MTSDSFDKIDRLITNLSRAILGKPEVLRLVVVGLIADGHLLIEDSPGVGKTSLAKALALSLDCSFARLQCTPDLLPSDIIGSSVFLPNKGEFEFRRGPLFTNVLLADEINRTTPRTQSALLEAMMERQVSADGVTYQLNRPFFVIATQNPFEFEGTYPLPENQLDRFMLRIQVGYPERAVEREVLAAHRQGEPSERVTPVLTSTDVQQLQSAVRNVKVDDAIGDYILDLVEATRQHEELSLGVSTRGALIYYRAAQALALTRQRDYVVPDDVKELGVPVMAHRIVPNRWVQEGQRQQAEAVIRQILQSVRVPS